MEKSIQFKDQEIKYKLKRSLRARAIRLTVRCDASVVATLPWWASERSLEKFLKSKAEWILDKIKYFRAHPMPIVRRSRKEYLQYKKAAHDLALRKLNEFNQFYNFNFQRISIRNQKTRWGSCSKKGNLNFSYRIALLPEHLSDYIIVHELCHLGEFNHSKNFWDLVEKQIPECKKLRRELKNRVL
jgi:hypothetical protein